MGCVFVIEVWLVSEKNKIFSAWGSRGVGGENSHRLLLEINGFISNPNDYQPINCCRHHPVIKLASSHVCNFRRTPHCRDSLSGSSPGMVMGSFNSAYEQDTY